MESKWRFVFSLISSIIILKVVSSTSVTEDFFGPTYIGKTTRQIIELNGYIAIDHTVATQDGYLLNLVEVLNPEVPNGFNESKEQLLFIHGLNTNANCFIVNSNGAEPKNQAHLDASSMSEEDLMQSLDQDPAADSLVYLASNFGHRIWLLNRRGTYQSQGHTHSSKQPFKNPIKNLEQTFFGGKHEKSKLSTIKESSRKSRLEEEGYLPVKLLGQILLNSIKLDLQVDVNPRYWNFSLDEQAKYDIPQVIDHILEVSGKDNLTILGHSNGGSLTLMSLIEYPDLANKSILWAPALYPDSVPFKVLDTIIGKFLLSYLGPFPPRIPIEFLDSTVCSNVASQLTICDRVLDALFGPGGKQQSLFPDEVSTIYDMESSHTYESYLQGSRKGKIHYFDYRNKRRNLIAYNQSEPPVYDVSKIKLRTLSFWAGVTDGLIPARTVFAIANDMQVPVEKVYLREPGLYFNHIGFLVHKDAARLVIIPSLIKIES